MQNVSALLSDLQQGGQSSLTIIIDNSPSTSYSKDQFRRMESTQGRLIKQCLGLPKSSHNTAMLKALNIDTVQNTVNRNVLNLYHRIFKIESPARSIMQFLLARYITYGTTVPGTLIDRVVSIGGLLLNAFLESLAIKYPF